MCEQSYICPTCGVVVVVGSPCTLCAKGDISSGTPARPAGKLGRVRPKTVKRRSWEQSEEADGLDLPHESFDYEDFIAREFGNRGRGVIRIRWYWWVTALFMVIILILFSLSGLR